MNRSVVQLGVLVLCTLAHPSGLAQIPDGYEVIQVSDDPDYDGPPAINNCGQVVFSKRINQSFDGEEIFLYDDRTGETTRLTNDNVRDAYPDINDNGTIVWSRGVGPGGTLEVAMYKNGQITILTNSPYGHYCSSPQINSLDHVAWNQFNGQGCSGSDIFFYDGQTTTRITDNGCSNQGESLNNNDEIVWTRYDLCAQPWWVGEIMFYSEGTVTQLTNDGNQLQAPDINDDQVVLWTTGSEAIEMWWEGMRFIVIPWGSGGRLNQVGHITYNCWQTDTETWQLCLSREGKSYQLTDDVVWNRTGSSNDLGEIAWESGDYPSVDIQLMHVVGMGDPDRDGDIDLSDLEAYVDCLRGPVLADCLGVCRPFDFDGDQDVDLMDFGAFQRAFDIDD